MTELLKMTREELIFELAWLRLENGRLVGSLEFAQQEADKLAVRFTELEKEKKWLEDEIMALR